MLTNIDSVMLARLRQELASVKFSLAIRRFAKKYSADQLRDDLGRWTAGASSDVRHILDIAKRMRLSGTRSNYNKCLDLCYPILERFQPPGSDRNTWDFYKCMNACLGR
jgi:hypothetical protein